MTNGVTGAAIVIDQQLAKTAAVRNAVGTPNNESRIEMSKYFEARNEALVCMAGVTIGAATEVVARLINAYLRT
jgi:hypothetical protein